MNKLEKVQIADENLTESDIENMIINNPLLLNLGNIEIVNSQLKEKYGILDILALDSTNNIYYEIELMLGELDSSHLTRVLDYWANEKSKKLYSEHIPVVICESVRGRFQKLVSILPDYLPLVLSEITLFKIENKNYINCEHIYYPNNTFNKKIKKKKKKNSMCSIQGLSFMNNIINRPEILKSSYRVIAEITEMSLGSISKFITILKDMNYINDDMLLNNVEKLIEYKEHINQVINHKK